MRVHKLTKDLRREEYRKEQAKLHRPRIIHGCGLLSDKLIEDIIEDTLNEICGYCESKVSMAELLVVEQAIFLDPDLVCSENKEKKTADYSLRVRECSAQARQARLSQLRVDWIPTGAMACADLQG